MHIQLKMTFGKYLHFLVNNLRLTDAYKAKGLQFGDDIVEFTDIMVENDRNKYLTKNIKKTSS